MKTILEVLSGAAFLFALGIVGAVEHSNNLSLIWWMLPCFAVMAIAAGVQEFSKKNNFIERYKSES